MKKAVCIALIISACVCSFTAKAERWFDLGYDGQGNNEFIDIDSVKYDSNRVLFKAKTIINDNTMQYKNKRVLYIIKDSTLNCYKNTVTVRKSYYYGCNDELLGTNKCSTESPIAKNTPSQREHNVLCSHND